MGESELVSVQGGHVHHYVPFMGLAGDITQEKGGQKEEVGQGRAEL